MADMLMTATIQRTTGLPEDAVVNTFAVNQVDANDDVLADACLLELEQFYNVIATSGIGNIAQYLSPNLSRAAGTMVLRAYEIPVGGGPMGSPKRQRITNLAALPSARTPFPDEVACVISLEASGHDAAAVNVPAGVAGPEGDIHPRARHKGRIYLGPLNTTTQTEAGGFVRPSSTFIGVVLEKVQELQQGIVDATLVGDLGVWSRADGLVRSAVAASIDNEYDTQRRRGTKATARTRVLLP